MKVKEVVEDNVNWGLAWLFLILLLAIFSCCESWCLLLLHRQAASGFLNDTRATHKYEISNKKILQALEALRKLKNEKNAELREAKIKLELLTSHVDAIRALRGEYTSAKDKEAAYESQIKENEGKVDILEQVSDCPTTIGMLAVQICIIHQNSVSWAEMPMHPQSSDFLPAG